MSKFALLTTLIALPTLALAQAPHVHHGTAPMAHGGHAGATDRHGAPAAPVVQAGQSAFAAIQEIVERLIADLRTDWSRVDIEALRRHLIDMDNVTLRSTVAVRAAGDATRFEATSADAGVTRSIRAMLTAHAATMDGRDGWSMRAEEIEGGAALTVAGGDQTRVRALGLIGILTVGMHHQEHHLAIATGSNPHAH
jgi:hypothetical protein